MIEPTTPWQQRRLSTLRQIESNQRELDVLERIGDLPGIATIYVYDFMNEVDITPTADTDARDLSLRVVSRMKDIGQPPTMATKTLATTTGKITYTIPGPMKGWKIKVSGGDPRCKVVPVKRTRTVPMKPAVAAVAAHEEEYVEYEIANPEECGAGS